ncbi:hypothetical protein [Biformimicrobium ophioploci]|uniref:Spore coat protein U domain-containing protein n=1 Tax=Biformimicrobium ophioploci TaxID=3036711 RepID=A0ABQ6LYY5_9GAMM|nr:hypothetical protein [Microbulbifer sp. NKW57]GMG87309.1 hypothetical protein MNKW57_16300 [Microbulbifer sp. NKW57]
MRLLHASKLLSAVGLLLLAIATGGFPAQAIAGPCDGIHLAVCNLDGSISNYPYNAAQLEQGNITFGIRSCRPNRDNCQNPEKFQLTVSGDGDAEYFRLTNASGDPQLVELYFDRALSGTRTNLNPGVETAAINGSNKVEPRQQFLRVDLAPGQTPASGTYTGTFSMTVRQESAFCDVGDASCNPATAPPRTVTVSFTIEITVEGVIQISGLEDMNLTANIAADTSASQDFCVYHLTGANFKITGDSSNGNGSFLLQATDQIPYQVTVEDVAAGAAEQLSEGMISTASWPGSTSKECVTGGENMRLTIRVLLADVQAAQDSSYTDTLTLTVEPE